MKDKYKILVVEDDRISQQIAQLMLEKMGYDVTCKSTSAEALEIYQAFNLVLSDIGLPDMSGIQLCQAIKQKQNKPLPIVAITANALSCAECINAGFDGFITKPLEYEALSSIVKPLLAG